MTGLTLLSTSCVNRCVGTLKSCPIEAGEEGQVPYGYLCSTPGCLLMWSLGGSVDGLRDWVPATRGGGLDSVPSFEFGHLPAPSTTEAVKDLWESPVSPCLSNKEIIATKFQQPRIDSG